MQFQERFLNETFTTKSKDIFSDVSMMLFVFDVASEQYAVSIANLDLGADRLEHLPEGNRQDHSVQPGCFDLCAGSQNG